MGNINYPGFEGCSSLTTINIGDKVERIPSCAFSGCKGLTSVTIPNSVTTFGDWAFSGCSNLKSLTFGSKLASIGKKAFSDCVSVTQIVSLATTPPTCGTQALDDINKLTCKLYVPEGSQTSYKAAEQWKEFFFIEEGKGSTGISKTVINPASNAKTYHTLDGREVRNPGKGIYIVNGKKVVMK